MSRSLGRLCRGSLGALLAIGLLATSCSRAPAPRTTAPAGPEPVAAPPAAAVHAPVADEPAVAPPRDDAPAEVPAPARPVGADGDEILVRVGLASDLARFDLPCCEGRVHVRLEGESVALAGPLVVTPASGRVEPPVHRLQAAALRDEGEARRMGADLARRTGWEADVGFDAASGLYRVRLGRFIEREAADLARRRLAGLGLGGAWVTQEEARLEAPALRISQEGPAGGVALTVPGRWLAVRPADEGTPLRVDLDGEAERFRGALLLYVNDRGTLNLINELPLEEYLRGVVPKELGPALYPRIEALKAQAVAARTYTLHHLGEFAAEGYDICRGPRCQVYGGRDAEHPLSDRAVAETAGQVILYGDDLIDSLYSATCGGHTEDAPVVFPWMDAPYLQGVPCPEARPLELAGAGNAPGGAPLFPAALARELMPVPPGAPDLRSALEARLESLARMARLPLPADRLGSLERPEVRRFVRSVFDLALDRDVLTSGVEVLPPLDEATVPALRRTAPETAEPPVTPDEAEWLLLGLAERTGLLAAEEAFFLGLEPAAAPRRLKVTRAADRRAGLDAAQELELPADLVTLVARDGRLGVGSLELVPGDRLTLYRWRGALRAVAQVADPGQLPVDRDSRYHSWRRVKTDGELGRQVARRFPGFELGDLEILSRGVSGRVGRLRLVDRSGRSELVEGLAVRWTLDLPDTRFEARRTTGGWEFTGGGWGHGVGLCQVGAYRMAGRGAEYREILGHYYSGVRLGRALVQRTASAGSGADGAVSEGSPAAPAAPARP